MTLVRNPFDAGGYSLAEMTQQALDRLSSDEDGFFLFVEEEAVDGMSHERNGTLMLGST